ncbi:MAG: chloride channel protein [Lentisphaeria bacterium]
MKKRIRAIHRWSIFQLVQFWRKKWHENSLVVLLALLIGVVTALAAAVLHVLVHYLADFSQWLVAATKGLGGHGWLLVFLLLPMLGITLSYLVQRYFGGHQYAKSLSPLILALERRQTFIPAIECINHVISSALSVGLGGSAGLEAPSVLTGAAIGSCTSRFFFLEQRHRTLLIGCGAAAAISAIFDSPVGGVLFVAEVLMPQHSVAVLAPMLLASAVAKVVSRLIFGPGLMFLAITGPWQQHAVPYYFVCGAACALIGVYVIRVAHRLGPILHRFAPGPWLRLLLGGGVLCVMLFLFPILRGQGYRYIELLFRGDVQALLKDVPALQWLPAGPWLPVIVIAAGVFLKAIVSVLTVDAGGDGGIFAPCLVIGAFTGFAFARLINLSGLTELQEFNFVAAGMCGVFTAVMHAPMTGIFLIAEVTGGYVLLVPLMIVSAVSWLIALAIEPNSVYRKALVEKKLVDDTPDHGVLQRVKVAECLNSQYHVLRANDTIKTVIQLVEDLAVRDDVFPVLDGNGKLLGIVHLEKVLAAMLNPQIHDLLLIFDLMDPPLGILSPDDDLVKAMNSFDKYNLRYLPVCAKTGKFSGFVERTPIFARYRRMISETESF